MFGEETTVLVEDGQLDRSDAEGVLDDQGVLELHEFDERGDAEGFDVAADAMLDD